MYGRAQTLIVVLGFLFGACGSAASSGDKYADGAACTPGATTMPRSTDDPCKQTGTPCSLAGGTGMKMCSAEGKWGVCMCVGVPVTTPITPPPTTPASKCGDGVVDMTAGEQCDGTTTVTCAAMLGPTALGVVNCVNCMIDATMCSLPATPGGAGMGAVGGAGTGM